MATTIPNVIRSLGNKHREGFTKDELIEALIMSGYGCEKASRRFKQCAASHQIIPVATETDTEKTIWASIYCPFHWNEYKKQLEQVKIRAVHIEKDGSVTFLS